MKDARNLSPLPEHDWPLELRQILDDMKGHPLNVHKLMANHPTLFNAWWNFRKYGVSGGDLPPRQRELVILRTAYLTGTRYEWASHIGHALSAGLTETEIARLGKGPDAPGWSRQDASLLSAVDNCALGHGILPETLDVLSNDYSARQIMDMIAIHGMYRTISTIINTCGLDLDDRFSPPPELLEVLPDG